MADQKAAKALLKKRKLKSPHQKILKFAAKAV